MRNVPAPKAVLEDLAELIPTLYEAIEKAAGFARGFFENRHEKADPFFAPPRVRYILKQYLMAAGHSPVEEEEPFCLGILPNNGISIKSGTYHIRILKANDGGLPVAGPSRVRQAFYHQLTLGLPGMESGSPTNLIVLWNAGKDFQLQNLLLACPKGGSTTKSSTEHHWICEIPHPVSVAIPVPVSVPAATDAAPPSDLPITLIPAAKEVKEDVGA